MPNNYFNNSNPIVCVQGLGYVGSAMAIAIAAANDKNNNPHFNVIGLDLDNKLGRKKVEQLNKQKFPFQSKDQNLLKEFKKTKKTKNFYASTNSDLLSLADIIICDVNLDLVEDKKRLTAQFSHLEKAIIDIGKNIKKNALIIIETTVPPGTCENFIVPIINSQLRLRNIDINQYYIAHSFERVMPGKDYLNSIRNFWRVYAGNCKKASIKCNNFFKKIINTKEYPLTELKSMRASEMTKIMENSYRAVNIAFIDEWSKFSKKINVNLFDSINAIKKRPTHSNIMSPGFGVGGYCLTKDPLLAKVGAEKFYKLKDYSFPFSEMSIRTNNQMINNSIEIIKDKIKSYKNKTICVLGASYREDVADLRFSPSVLFIEAISNLGAKVTVYDPLVTNWKSKKAIFTNTLPKKNNYDVVVATVKHSEFQKIEYHKWLKTKKSFIFDANFVLTDRQIKIILKNGFNFDGIGRSID